MDERPEPSGSRTMTTSRRFTSERWSHASISPQTGRTFVITGANSGLGLEAARALVGADARVILACRSEHKARVALGDIRETTDLGEIAIEQLDLADLMSVRAFAERLTRRGEQIHGLMNNAGVFALDRSRTRDGFETHFGVNHLGHFALTGLLLPIMSTIPGSRVITVSSLGHRPGRLDLEDPMFERRTYSRWGAYFQSKLANLLFTRELHRRLESSAHPTIAVAAHPGTARTEIGKLGSSTINRLIRRFMPILVRDGVQGCRSQVRAAVDERVQGGDFIGPRFLFLGAPVHEAPSARARNDETALQLWHLSESLTGVNFAI
jgi:NAD(P)-dependent dehydrogenase (short-subunit alcohol dehydrogenase family)